MTVWRPFEEPVPEFEIGIGASVPKGGKENL